MTSSTTSTWLVQPNNGGRNAVLVARAMVDPKAGKISIRILNPRNESDCPKGKSNCSNEVTTGGWGAFGLHIFHRADPSTDISVENQKQPWQIVLDAGDALSAEEQLYTG